MSDLQTLLRQADGGPVESFDFEAAIRTAHVRTVRRRVGGALVLLLLAAVLVPTIGNATRESGFIGRIHEPDGGPSAPIEDNELTPDTGTGPTRGVPSTGSRQSGAPVADPVPDADRPDTEGRPTAESLGLTGRLAFTTTQPTFYGSHSCFDEPCHVTGPSDLRFMDLATGHVTPVTSSAVFEQESRWSPDGSRLAYSVVGQNSGAALYTIRADGSDRRRIVSVERRNARKATWSPDGRRLAFLLEPTSPAYLPDHGQEIWMVDADGTNLRRVDEIGDHDFPTSPAWSPDGQYLAFARLPWTGPRIFVLDLEGGEIRSLGAGSQPAWAPDGKHLAVVSGEAIRVISTAVYGGDQVNVISREGLKLGEPTWSPDGRWLALAASGEGSSEAERLRRSIRVVRPNGDDMHTVIEGGEDYWAPSWTAR